MKTYRKIFGALLVLALASLIVWLPSDLSGPVGQPDTRSVGGAPASSPARQEPEGQGFFASDPVTPSLTIAAGELPPAAIEYTLDREVNPRLGLNPVADPNYNPPGGPDPLLAVQESVEPAAPNAFGTPLVNVNGQGYSFVNPPDTVGDVGPSHYIQMINGSSGTRVQLYNKTTGAPSGSAFMLDDLAPSGACQTGLGDPIVLYDKLADRWLLSEFAESGNHLCVYVSRTNNPAGQYYFYDFTTPTFPDYPKYAVWPDAYYVSTNENNPTAYALNRTRMLAGQSATFQRFTAPSLSGFDFQALTPADLDGATAPPSGAPGYYARHRDTEVHGPSGLPNHDLLEIWAFDVDWTTPSNSSFSKIADIQMAEFDSTLCGLTSYSCIPQPGTSVRLDPLREVVMWRLAYRNFSNRQVLVGNFSTDVNGADRAGVRWFELRKTGSGAWTKYQEGTYSPGSLSRWMGAIAMDGSGNIALGYNVGNSSTYPGLRYAGRLASDPLGTLPQGEHTLVSGSGSNGSNRYGDYSAMSIDPVDDCTFWFTGEWNAGSQWSTRIGKLKFDQCGQPTGARRVYLPALFRYVAPTTGTVAGRVTQASNGQAISGAQVCVLSPNLCATTNAQGNYTIADVPAGSRTVRATASGYTAQQKTVTVPAGGTATANFALAGGQTTVTITQSQSQSIDENNSIACVSQSGTAQNAYLRQFTLTAYGITGPYDVSEVRFGIEAANSGSGSGQSVSVRLYRKTNPAGSLTYGNLTQIGSATRTISDQSLALYTMPVAGAAPAGSVLVVEVFTPNGQAVGNFFFIGSNGAGQTGASYIAAADCNASQPTDLASLGFPDMHIVMNVTGTTGSDELGPCVTIGDAIEAGGSPACTAVSEPAGTPDSGTPAIPDGSSGFRWGTRAEIRPE